MKKIEVKISQQDDALIHKITLPRDCSIIKQLKVNCHAAVIGPNHVYVLLNDLESVNFATEPEHFAIIETIHASQSYFNKQTNYIQQHYALDIPLFQGYGICMEALYHSQPTLYLKFTQAPKMDYWITYETENPDENTKKTLRDNAHYVFNNNNTMLYQYFNGKLAVYR